MGAFGRSGTRLFRLDGRIAINTIRETFGSWHDRLIAGTMLLVGLGVLQSSSADRPWGVAAAMATGVGLVLGSGAGRWVAARLAFHASDGLLAADALQRPARHRYAIAWHAIGAALLAAVTLIVRPSLLIVSVPAYLAGIVAATIAGSVSWPPRMAGSTRPGWALRASLRRPRAGMVAAMILLVSLLWARTLGNDAFMAMSGVGSAVLSLALTPLDDGIVRFMAIAGHGAVRTIGRHARTLASFVAIAAPAGWLAAGPMTAAIITAIAALALLLLTLRVLAYRLHGKRFADMLVSILVGLLALVTYAIPIALPIAVIATLWSLQRRGAAKTWLLA